MSDYGADLTFGSFITPSAAQPDVTVALAVTSEHAGLDLVTFQDHPYQSAFLDTWTLMSYVAARTDRIQLSGNVHNLPLRPPAPFARAVSSLDLLSGGRVALGLGAGAFWDAIVAMGGTRRTPGQAVSALEEAISIFREIWDTSTKGGVFRDGEFYQVSGAKRGPAPAHRIPIWLGAYKPRMLRLVGSSADGWLPSLGYLDSPDAIAQASARIDDAALDAGREPADIRRLLNISAETAQPELLADLAISHGFDTFILGSDDAVALERFAASTAPQTRELVAAARGR
jgi:alkanesulfonate monooxygenase SsuD/methylene tetrahydromethanopterin reductase-like flavin-dependent oxidoreductase (luciferase family)